MLEFMKERGKPEQRCWWLDQVISVHPEFLRFRARKMGWQVIDLGNISGAQNCTQTAFNNHIKAQKNTLWQHKGKRHGKRVVMAHVHHRLRSHGSCYPLPPATWCRKQRKILQVPPNQRNNSHFLYILLTRNRGAQLVGKCVFDWNHNVKIPLLTMCLFSVFLNEKLSCQKKKIFLRHHCLKTGLAFQKQVWWKVINWKSVM